MISSNFNVRLYKKLPLSCFEDSILEQGKYIVTHYTVENFGMSGTSRFENSRNVEYKYLRFSQWVLCVYEIIFQFKGIKVQKSKYTACRIINIAHTCVRLRSISLNNAQKHGHIVYLHYRCFESRLNLPKTGPWLNFRFLAGLKTMRPGNRIIVPLSLWRCVERRDPYFRLDNPVLSAIISVQNDWNFAREHCPTFCWKTSS